MKQFLESICIRDGQAQHLEWHQRRVDATMAHFYGGHQHSWNLASCIDIPSEFETGVVKCRIVYDAHLFSVHYFPYESRKIQSLRLVEMPEGFDYRYKYADRSVLEELYDRRDDADDILLTRGGWVMDTSFANIAFEKNARWYTPSLPLLAGTTWKRLIAEGNLVPQPISAVDFGRFDFFKVFNAMNTFESSPAIPVNQILHA